MMGGLCIPRSLSVREAEGGKCHETTFGSLRHRLVKEVSPRNLYESREIA